MDENQEGIKFHKPDTKGQILYESVYMRDLDWVNS